MKIETEKQFSFGRVDAGFLSVVRLFLIALVAALSWQGRAQPVQQPSRVVTRLPLLGDETSIATVVADPRRLTGSNIVMCGSVQVINYYNFRYANSSSSHFSLDFMGLTKDMKPAGRLTVYAKRDLAGKLVEEILKVQKEDAEARKIVRLKARITWLSFGEYDGKFDEDAELVDWQFLNRDLSGWGPWAKGAAPPSNRAVTPVGKARTTGKRGATKGP